MRHTARQSKTAQERPCGHWYARQRKTYLVAIGMQDRARQSKRDLVAIGMQDLEHAIKQAHLAAV